jgi:hypothetical protein
MKLYQMAEQFLDLPQMLRLKSDYGLNLPISAWHYFAPAYQYSVVSG